MMKTEVESGCRSLADAAALAGGLGLALAGCAAARVDEQRGRREADGDASWATASPAPSDHPEGGEAGRSAPTRSADFEKADRSATLAAKKSRRPVEQASAAASPRAFEGAADDSPALLEARFNQGAVLYECGRRGRGHPHLGRPAQIRRPALANLGYVAWKKGDIGPRRVAVPARDRGGPAAHRRGAEQPGADPARQGPPRRLGRGEEAATSVRR